MEICLLMKKICNQIEANRNEKLKSDGLTGTQLDLMLWIAGRGDKITSQKDIGTHFGIKHTTTIQLIKKLEEKQYIHRKINSDNARYRNVYLTDCGWDKVNEVKENTGYIKQQLYQGISGTELAGFERILHVIYGNLQNGIADKRREDER